MTPTPRLNSVVVTPFSQLGLQHTMAVPAVLCARIVGLAAIMPQHDADLAITQ